MSHSIRYCSLCGLLCPVATGPGQAAVLPVIDDCPRRRSWLAAPLAELSPPMPASSAAAEDAGQAAAAAAGKLAELIRSGRQPLLWIAAGDVATMRAAVQLAQQTPITLHVGSSTGSQVVHRVTSCQGWLGTTLAEVANRADLIITLGDSLLSESPLLVPRFIEPAVAAGRSRWIHLSPHPTSASAAAPIPPTASLLNQAHRWHWPRQDWYPRLTQLLWGLQPEYTPPRLSAEVEQLVELLQATENSVWLWDVDEFCNAEDELLVGRLLEIARRLSSRQRCSLLCLDSQPGRVTAHEALLWLTGCHGTARFQHGGWVNPMPSLDWTLGEWQANFDPIIVIQALPLVGALPNLPAAFYLLPAMHATLGAAPRERVTTVAAAGSDGVGHVMRGDRATIFYCPADSATKGPALPTAADILRATQGVLASHRGQPC